MNKLKVFLTSLIAVLGFSPVLSPALMHVGAQSNIDNINCGASGSLDGTNCGDISEGASKVSDTIKKVIQLFQIIVGLVSVFMIIFGGFKYISSGGETNSVKSAMNTIRYAVIGLVVVLIAQAVVQFVLSRFTN